VVGTNLEDWSIGQDGCAEQLHPGLIDACLLKLHPERRRRNDLCPHLAFSNTLTLVIGAAGIDNESDQVS